MVVHRSMYLRNPRSRFHILIRVFLNPSPVLSIQHYGLENDKAVNSLDPIFKCVHISPQRLDFTTMSQNSSEPHKYSVLLKLDNFLLHVF